MHKKRWANFTKMSIEIETILLYDYDTLKNKTFLLHVSKHKLRIVSNKNLVFKIKFTNGLNIQIISKF